MIIRIQSSEGTKRLEISQDDTLDSLFDETGKLFGCTPADVRLYRDRHKQTELERALRMKLKTAHLHHGDMLFLNLSGSMSSRPGSANTPVVKEDSIDVELWKAEGRIRRNQTSASMFKLDDLSIEPWDEQYLAEKEIKFLSFHAYMRKQTSGVDKGKYFKLENFKAASKINPDGSKCSVVDLPSSVTLNRQRYRHVDNIVFENPAIMDKFLNYWRTTGHQRMGFLYGRYKQHSEVPLGIKAEVCAIYEPPQESSVNSLRFHDDPNKKVVDYIAEKLGLRCVGWILTDLVAENRKTGTVQNFRNPKTHFLSAEECVTAACFQNNHPNPCRLASNGYYGSKFTTVVVSGDQDLQISFEGYQVSSYNFCCHRKKVG